MVHTFFPPPGRSQRIGQVAGGLMLGAMLALAGCASVPPPDGSMNQAQALLQSARDAGAAQYDPVDLGFAQAKFQQAQTTMAAREYAAAADLADEARADAELARTRARLGAARAQIQAKVDENTRLRQQMEQPPAPAQTAPAAPANDEQGGTDTLQDMPAPSSSVLSAPLPQDDGTAPAPAASQGQNPNQGGQP